MSTRRTAKVTTDNDSGPVRTTRSTTKVSGSSPDSKKGSTKKKGTNGKSSKSASKKLMSSRDLIEIGTDSSNMQQFVNLTPEEKELMEMVKKQKADNFESPSKKERDMEIEEESDEQSEEEEDELSESMAIVQTQLIPSVGKDSGTKSLDKTLDVQEGENDESEAALEGIGALEEISELEGSPQVKAGGNSTQYMESQELTGLTHRLRPKVPLMESPRSEKAESVKSDMLNNINSLAEIEEEKAKEIDQEVEKELAVDTLEGDMGTFEKDDESDEGDRVIMPSEESKDRMEEEQEQNIQKKKELEDKQLEEDREMIENATNIEVHSDESGETVEVIKPALITRPSQDITVLFDDKTPKSSVQRENNNNNNVVQEILGNEEQELEELEGEQEEATPKPEPEPNQDFTGEMEEQDVFDQLIVESSKGQENIIEQEEEKIPAQEVYNITQEEILQNYKGNKKSKIRNQQKKQDSDDGYEKEAVEEEEKEEEEIYQEAEEEEEEEEKSTIAAAKEKGGARSVRREYSVYEDWRILESLAAFEKQNGSAGLKSINTWTALRDPLTKKKLTEIGRTAESLKTRMYKTLTLLTKEDKNQIAEYIKNHSKEEALAAYCRFDVNKTTKKKKFQGIFKEPSMNTSNLRKNTYDQKPAVVADVTKKQQQVTKAIPKKLPGLVEKAFEEEHSDDIEDITTFLEEQQQPRENRLNPNLPIISEVLDFSVEKTTPNKSVTQSITYYAPAKSRNIKPIEQPPSRMMISSTRSEKPKSNKKRKDYRMVSYPVAAPVQTTVIDEIGPCLKRVKTDRYFESKSLLISDEFRTKISTDKFDLPQNDIRVFVDHENNFRQFAILEDSQNDFNQNLIIEKLSQIASKYKIRQDDVHNIFKSVSNDFDDLQLYLQTKNPFILWESSEDRDLLDGDETAIRYLLQLKGEARIARRRQYLIGE